MRTKRAIRPRTGNIGPVQTDRVDRSVERYTHLICEIKTRSWNPSRVPIGGLRHSRGKEIPDAEGSVLREIIWARSTTSPRSLGVSDG